MQLYQLKGISTIPGRYSSNLSFVAYLLLVLLASYPAVSVAVNFTQCLENVMTCANGSDPSIQACAFLNISNVTAFSLLRTSNGNPILTTDTATALSYHGCYNHCGKGQEPFSWSVFSQEYSQWLLPYLALLSQLPFGAPRRMDNFMSVILTLGSPTLAGYSLYLTVLNARWVNDKLFSGIDYPSSTVRLSVVRTLSGLQQVPLRVHPGRSARFESLVIHPDNDNWWITLAEELNYSHTWSIASATSIAWVVIAYLLTVADSLSNVANSINSNGQGTGSVWLWLLPIVIGWLVLSPKCDYDRVHDAYRRANRQVFAADSRDATAAPIQVTYNFGLTISSSPDWKLYGRNITSPDESRIPPVFNYARTLSWSRTVYLTSLSYRAAWRKSSWHRVGVDGNRIPRNVSNDIPRESRLGNRDQVVDYCQPDHHEYPGINVLWPRGVVFNMIVASLMSLQLQWGTTIAAILAAWFTPTIGLGCRSMAYLIYGLLSTTVWVLLLLSSVLGYYAHYLVEDLPVPDLESDEQPTSPASITGHGFAFQSGGGGSPAIPLHRFPSPHVGTPLDTDEPASITTIKYFHTGLRHAQTIARVSDWLRWIGKFFAIVNAVGIITNSVFQYSGMYDNCYCDSSIFKWGISFAFNVISPMQSDIDLAHSAWIGALALGLTCSAFFVGSIYLIRDSLPL
ncbi:hypothetical protein L210DRAFT_3762207 [Boletus edulis BED1]|uniref:Uncharacterized protein n=1 Tax=Boletus edulis BED1 TaxID=1328754 RepID=A0AAD4BQB5_BOLED|nr:hypothetical protein L210DRAFT_3762207 [Boletus edulis BED1]